MRTQPVAYTTPRIGDLVTFTPPGGTPESGVLHSLAKGRGQNVVAFVRTGQGLMQVPLVWLTR